MYAKEKICSCCQNTFMCKVDDIVNCQCYTIKLLEKESNYIKAKFLDCICKDCISNLQKEYKNLE